MNFRHNQGGIKTVHDKFFFSKSSVHICYKIEKKIECAFFPSVFFLSHSLALFSSHGNILPCGDIFTNCREIVVNIDFK